MPERLYPIVHSDRAVVVVVVCVRTDTADRKAKQMQRDSHISVLVTLLSLLFFWSFHIKYASEASRRYCISMLQSLEQRWRSNDAHSQTTLHSVYPSRKYRHMHTNINSVLSFLVLKGTVLPKKKNVVIVKSPTFQFKPGCESSRKKIFIAFMIRFTS